MGTGAKVGIGLGVTAGVGLIAWLVAAKVKGFFPFADDGKVTISSLNDEDTQQSSGGKVKYASPDKQKGQKEGGE